MKKRILFIVGAIALLHYNIFAQDFYDINTINTVELNFSQSNWDYLLDSLVSNGQEERLLGTATINGITYDSVGVRYKGNSSYNANQIKNPLNIKLDYFIDGQTHEGYGTIKLANAYKDPSFIRETLSYEIARTYMPASKSNYIKVYINGTYLGLYTSNQDVDKDFLKSNFYSKNNPFFKGELVNDTPQNIVTVWGYQGTDSSSYKSYYEMESDSGWEDLISFLDILNNNPDSVFNYLNIDRHLWMLAFDNLLVNLDSPINFAHNFYLYKDDNGLFNPIIWDLNESLGGFTSVIGGNNLTSSGLQNLDPYFNLYNNNYPIISKILSNDTYKKIYIAHMKTIMSDYFENGYYKTRAEEIQNIIDDEVNNDPNKFYTYSDFKNNITTSTISSSGGRGGPGGGNESIIGIAELMDSRVAHLNSLSDFQAIAPSISELGVSPSSPSPNSDVYISAKVTDATIVQLGYRYSFLESFNKVEMFDDGNHNDGEAGDGIYGVSINTGNMGIEYYIYGENDDAVSFSPERAEYEFYTLSVSNDLVINEFMASNSSTIADDSSEYDDWIELYNNSDYEISLNGYHLSDNGDNLTKWTFPDTSIAANGYLLIWADNDIDQPVLHASFKLSSSGETIYLSDADTTIIDQISFVDQTTDISYGRYPNGTGGFTLMSPTPEQDNVESITDVEYENSEIPTEFNLYQNYPNPFNPTTQIKFSVPETGLYKLKIYNIIGQEVATLINEKINSGVYTVNFDASNLSSGIYIYSLSGSKYSKTKKMILMK